MLAPINCGGRCIFPQTVSDWQIGALSTAQYVNQPPSSQALHLLSLVFKVKQETLFLLSPGPALSPSAGSLIYLLWRAPPHYLGAHQPITIHFKWRAHQVGVTKEKCQRSLDLLIVLMPQVLRQTRGVVSRSIKLRVSNLSTKEVNGVVILKICAESSRECGTALKTFWALCGVEPLYFGGERMAVIRPADNKTQCHKSSQKTKAVRLIFAHSVRARTVCCSDGIVSL